MFYSLSHESRCSGGSSCTSLSTLTKFPKSTNPIFYLSNRLNKPSLNGLDKVTNCLMPSKNSVKEIIPLFY